LSFELDEEKLATPPVKDDQEAITSFWGIYPWPHTNYNRFAHLEGLEQTADETKTMARALEYIKSAHELGLSIDGCLGYLNGPDINNRCAARSAKTSVFGKPKYVEEPCCSLDSIAEPTARSIASLSAAERRHQELERMCITAGWSGSQLNLAVESIRNNDHIYPEAVSDNSAIKPSLRETNGRRESSSVPTSIDVDPSTMVLIPDDFDSTTQSGERGRLLRQRKLLDIIALNPKELTMAQREMLLEIEWAGYPDEGPLGCNQQRRS